MVAVWYNMCGACLAQAMPRPPISPAACGKEIKVKKANARAVRITALVALLCALTAYVLLDTFVIEHKISEVSTAPPVSESVADSEPEYELLNAYSDSELSVILKHYRKYDTDIYLADIRTDSPEYLKCAFAHDTYGKNIKEKTSETARRVGAVVAINGDYYGARESGFVIRNGELYRAVPSGKLESLVVDRDGSFEVISSYGHRAAELLENGARHVFTFGPGLVTDGEICVSRTDEVEQSMNSNPRTAIAQIGDGHYVFLVSDGRTVKSEGLSLYELAEFLKDIGARTAYNLDGGGSSTMYFMGEIVNYPTTNGNKLSERSVSDIVYIGH